MCRESTQVRLSRKVLRLGMASVSRPMRSSRKVRCWVTTWSLGRAVWWAPTVLSVRGHVYTPTSPFVMAW
eukprot:38843-Eustigmatos_ZCMA.PRE.1